MKILTITEALKEILTRYKILNKELSKLNNFKESDNKLDEME